jgi:hypothetical protein
MLRRRKSRLAGRQRVVHVKPAGEKAPPALEISI